jgi:cobalt transporter subunit CbtB
MTMQNQTSTSSTIRIAPISITFSKSLQLVSAMLLGIVILYGVGFVQTSVAHNAAHDMRHSQGFPCH